jgi:hypothetical protein
MNIDIEKKYYLFLIFTIGTSLCDVGVSHVFLKIHYLSPVNLKHFTNSIKYTC